MSGKAKIETLTNAWYGFAVFSTLGSLLLNGIGIGSIVGAIACLLVSWLVTYLIGRSLLRRSSTMRFVLLVLTGLFSVLGALGVAKMALLFFQMWELRILEGVAYGAVCTWMYARSFKTLMDPAVKVYVGS